MKKYYFNSDLRFSVKEEKNSENLKANQIRVRMRNCGICGSDIHYYLHGENGGRKIMEPLMLGHEAVGEILEVGSNLEQFKKDDRISINPALYCYKCKFCKTKKFNLCENVLFFGSAAKMPHTQGAFREQIIVDKSQCHLIDTNTSFEELSLAVNAEPTDLVNVTINPEAPNEVYMSANQKGLLKIVDGVPTILYDETNSPLERINIGGADAGIRIYGSQFDSQGNLWFVQSKADEGLIKLTPGGQFQKVDISGIFNATGEVALTELALSRENYVFFGRAHKIY